MLHGLEVLGCDFPLVDDQLVVVIELESVGVNRRTDAVRLAPVVVVLEPHRLRPFRSHLSIVLSKCTAWAGGGYDPPVSIDASLAGKRALVTGAGQGVGEAIARELARAGCNVVVNDFHADRADATVKSITDEGNSALAAVFDVTDYAAVAAGFGAVGRVDILVNNAGNAGPDSFGTIASFVDTTPAQWEPFFAVNTYGVMNCVHAALPGMTERGWGRVITIVSDAGRSGGAKLAAYSAAKAAAAGFGRAIAREVARHGVTVNTVSLGTIRTATTSAIWDEPEHQARRDAMLADYLVRRPGEPDDAAWVVTMLASPRASWITGQTIPVNGGFSFAL